MSKVGSTVFFKSLAIVVAAVALAFGALAFSSPTRTHSVSAQGIEGCSEQGPTGTLAIDIDDIEQIGACLLIVKDAGGVKNVEFDFAFESGSAEEVFGLKHGGIQEIFGAYIDLGSGVLITEQKEGWVLVDIECDASAGEDVEFDIDIKGRSVEVTSKFSEEEAISAVCIFYNKREDDEQDDGRGRFIGGGLFGNIDTAQQNRARAGVIVATPQPAPASAPAIRPPSTGDGGLLP